MSKYVKRRSPELQQLQAEFERFSDKAVPEISRVLDMMSEMPTIVTAIGLRRNCTPSEKEGACTATFAMKDGTFTTDPGNFINGAKPNIKPKDDAVQKMITRLEKEESDLLGFGAIMHATLQTGGGEVINAIVCSVKSFDGWYITRIYDISDTQNPKERTELDDTNIWYSGDDLEAPHLIGPAMILDAMMGDYVWQSKMANAAVK